jgi:IS30 family transposase
VCFCDPNLPWQRGTNENNSGLLSQYFPEGIDMSQPTPHDLDEAAYSFEHPPSTNPQLDDTIRRTRRHAAMTP